MVVGFVWDKFFFGMKDENVEFFKMSYGICRVVVMVLYCVW